MRVVPENMVILIIMQNFQNNGLFLLYYIILLFLGLKNLKSINLSFTLVNDNGLKRLSGLTSIKYLNLDSRNITDAGLAALTCMFFFFLFPSYHLSALKE